MLDITVGTRELTKDSIVELYKNVGWIRYTENPDNLFKAIMNSTYVVTIREGRKILGLARSISDDTSIHYLQDILVHPDYQRKKIGKSLLEKCLERFKHVRTHVILTDDEERQRWFYESLDYKNIKDLDKYKLNCYVKMTDVELV